MLQRAEADPGAASSAAITVTTAIEEMIAALPVEDLERLARHFSPSALRRRRLDERADLILAYAGEVLLRGGARSGRALAGEVATTLRRYEATAWRIDRERGAPRDPRHAILFRILQLGRGNRPGTDRVRRILSGLQKPPARSHSI
jgi:hypothetical protein